MPRETKERSGATRPTDQPRAGPTIVPAFDLAELARDSGFRTAPLLRDDTVLELVVDVSWSEAQLDLVERELIGCIDGLSPLILIESTMDVPRDELHATLLTLIARGFVRAVAAPNDELPASRTFGPEEPMKETA